MEGFNWAEKSVNLVKFITMEVESFLRDKNMNYKVEHGMNGFNDRLVIKDHSNKDDYLFISLVIGWFNADAELAIVHRFNKDSEYELITNQYLEFDNAKYEDAIESGEQGRFVESGLDKNKIKYYPAPFDDKEYEILEDIKTFLLKQNKYIKDVN